jgi:hypothetical protein
VRNAILLNDRQKAAQLMRGSVDAELQRARQLTIDLIESLVSQPQAMGLPPSSSLSQ